MVWKTAIESAPKKAKSAHFARKVMATDFWDAIGVLLVDYLPSGVTINEERYWETLNKLRSAIKRKWPCLLSNNVLLPVSYTHLPYINVT